MNFNSAKMIDEINAKTAAKINEMIRSSHRHTALLMKAEQTLEMIKPALEKEGLEISEIRSNMTGETTESGCFTEESKLVVSLRAISTGKFKFIAFRGYKKDGSGRNETSLQTKAQKLEDQLEEASSCVVAINHYSLEKNDTKATHRAITDSVQISLWIA